jgi:hypothetical protein
VYDFFNLLGLKRDIVESAFDRFQDQQGPIWPIRAEPFTQGHLRATRPELKANRRDVVIDQITENTAIGRSIAMLATTQQRPLYCGITVNFGRRVTEHMDRKTDFAQALTDIDITDCAVLWVPIEDEDAKKASLLTLDSVQFEAYGDFNTHDDESLAQEIPLVKAFESLMIRVAMPITNKAMDS